MRRPDTLASGRTLSFYRRGFLPWAFVRTWVSGQRSCLSSYLLLEVGYSPSLVLVFAGRFLPFGGPGACYSLLMSELVGVYPWLSTLCSLAVEVVTLVLCQVLVGLPLWRWCACGFLGPVVFLVFTLGHLS